MRSLLADIARAARSPGTGATDPVRDARDAVLSHLRMLIATRRGTVWPALDFGIDDPTEIFHDYPGAVEDLRRALEHAIRRYEPRLREPSVRHRPSQDLVLRFDIEALLDVEGRLVPVRFTSQIDRACQTEVT